MRVLVIGGTLFVGRHIVETLLAHGHSVAVLNRGQTPDALAPEVVRLRADRHQHDQVRAAVDGHRFDAVVDCIGYEADDVRATIELFRGQIWRYVFISSTSVYRPGTVFPIDEWAPLQEGSRWRYAQQKVEIEASLAEAGRAFGFPWVSLRPAYIYGPYNSNPMAEFALFARVEAGRPVLVPGDGSFVIHHTHGRDLAEATLVALTNDRAIGNCYNVMGAYAQTGDRLVRAAAAAAGREAEIVHVPVRNNEEARRFFFFQPRPTQIYSIERARRELGWQPAFDIDAGLRDSYRWYRETGYAQRHTFDFSEEDKVLAELAGKS